MREVMGKRYSARQRAYESPRGLSHVSLSQKLSVREPASSRGVSRRGISSFDLIHSKQV